MPAFIADDLEVRARAAADMHDLFCTPDMIRSFLDRERNRYESLMLMSGVADRWEVQTISVVGPLSPVALLGRAVLGVFEFSNNQFRRLEPTRQGGSWPSTNTGVAYRWQVARGTTGPVLYLYPQPTSGTYQVFYAPEITPWRTAPTTSVWYPNGHEELLVLGAAISCLARESDRNPALEKQYADMLARIEVDLKGEQREGAYVRNVDDTAAAPRDWTWSPEINPGDLVFL
jgi:hypothetical protein